MIQNIARIHSGITPNEPPKKKKGRNEDTDQDNYFNAICDHYARLPAPEYTYLVCHTSDDNGTAP